MTGANYSAWRIDAGEFPRGNSIADQIHFLLGYAVLAPSTHNTQPWLFSVSGDALTITANHRLKLAHADPLGRHLWISLGTCTYNLEVAAAHFGLATHIAIDDEAEAVSIGFKPARQQSSIATLFMAIPRRFSDKKVYSAQQLPVAWLGRLPRFAPARLHRIDDPADIKKIADQYYVAAAVCAYPAFGRELSSWLRGNRTKRGDGMPGAVSGLSQPQAVIGKLLSRFVPPAIKVLARKYRQIVATSPELGLITTATDTPTDWFAVGRMYEHIALTAAQQGLSTTPLAAMIEDRDGRAQLARACATSELPQLFYRVAVPDFLHVRTPRRAIHEVMQ